MANDITSELADYSFEICEDPIRWLDFLKRSPQGTVYNSLEVHQAFGRAPTAWFLSRKGVPQLGILISMPDGHPAPLPHTYYDGPMLGADASAGKMFKQTSNILKLTEILMHKLAGEYGHVGFSLHPGLTDVRGFDWFNYHEPELGRCTLQPRYTAVVDLTDGFEAAAARFHSTRRQEPGYAIDREGLYFTKDGSIEELTGLYIQTFERQGQTPDPIEVDAVVRLYDGLKALSADRLYFVRDENDVAVAGALVAADLHGTAHLPVVGVGATRFGGSLLYSEIIRDCCEGGFAALDMNGANSPQRAQFKHSCGAAPVLYFDLEWQRP